MSNIRVNTLRIVFAKRPSALEIHEWIDTVLAVTVDQLEAIQLDGHQNCVFLKFVSSGPCEEILRRTNGQSTFVTADKERIHVTLEQAIDNMKMVRVLNLPVEVDNQKLLTELAGYGRVVTLQDEVWNKKYKFTVKTGVRIAKMEIKKDIPSYITIDGYRCVVIYQGQPRTCSYCQSPNHERLTCPSLQEKDARAIRRWGTGKSTDGHEGESSNVTLPILSQTEYPDLPPPVHKRPPVQTPVGEPMTQQPVNLNSMLNESSHVQTCVSSDVAARDGPTQLAQGALQTSTGTSSNAWADESVMDVEGSNTKRPYERDSRAKSRSPVRKTKLLSQHEQTQVTDRQESLDLAKSVIEKLRGSQSRGRLGKQDE